VTGGAGFIGSNTVDLLLEKGYDVAVVDNLSTGREHNLNTKARFHRIDITSPRLDAVFAKEQPEHVIHLAAQIDVRKSLKEPAFDASVNLLGTINVLECAKRNKVKKVVYSSSGGAVYGEPQKLPCDESHPIRPLCPYGASKYAAEKYIQMYGQLHGLDYNILRYGNVYGPRQDPLGEAGVIAIFTGLLAKGREPVIWGDGEQTRDFCFVKDIAAANLTALQVAGKARVYNIGSGQGTSVNTITRMLIDEMGLSIVPRHEEPVSGEVRNIHLNAALAKDELGWDARTSLKDGISQTVGWVRNA
jgi:UDP-glucose 4-epimerase